ncbi:MAG: MBL fold metallo-hydrolase [Planctomycetaceae bacterium]|nr:MBL fold metallo-hydrolase [Planctomycetaceae bacterium]
MRRVRQWGVGLVTAAILVGVSGFAAGWFKPTETTVTEIAPGVWFRKTQWEPNFIGCNQGWVIFDDFVLVIDANFPNQAEEIIPLIRKTTDKPIRYVFDTHYHGDHADGNPVFAGVGATAIASENAKEEFETKGLAGFTKSQTDKPQEYRRLKYQLPALYFPRKLVIEDAKQRVELIHFDHGHTKGDAVAWLPKLGILFTGDSCLNGAFNYTGDGNTETWIGALTQMRQLPIKTICPGHGEMSDATLIDRQRRYFVELRQYIGDAIAAGKSLDDIKGSIDFPWYKEWTGVPVSKNVENIEHVFKELRK